MIDKIDDSNFVLIAAKYYDNPQCFDTLEFYEDMSRFKYIKRLFNRYEDTGELKERLIINHITILYNVFGAEATRLLFFKLDGYHHLLKPFIILLGRLPDVVHGIGIDNKTIYTSDIIMDENVVGILRKI